MDNQDYSWTEEETMGHHEELALSPRSLRDTFKEEETKNLKAKIKRLEAFVQHLEWHGAVARRAPKQFPGSQKAIKEAKEAMKRDSELFCTSCEIENLQKLLEIQKNKTQKHQ